MEKDIKAWLAERWKLLPSNSKQLLVVALAGVVVLGLLYMMIRNKPVVLTHRQTDNHTRNLLGQRGSELELGIANVNKQFRSLSDQNKSLKAQVEELSTKKPPAAPNSAQMEALIRQQVAVQVAQALKEEKPSEGQEGNPSTGPSKTPHKDGYHPEHGKRVGNVAAQKGHDSTRAAARPRGQGSQGPTATSTAPDIKIISAPPDKITDKKPDTKDVETFLPAGSIFSGTLITGIDASCGKSSKKDPFPVLLRVKKEAILPNRYRADVRECFLIAAGWGDLGAERAYFRAERLSCIRTDGKAIETKIDMYGVGEDGKAGVRGRLVSKTGALLNKALLAGFMQGFAQVFTSTPVASINTGPIGQGSQMPFQRSLSKQAMQTAGLQGAGSALERLSKYYIDMAEDTFPVIEIDAGRAIDFVLIIGKSLKLQARNNQQDTAK